MTILFLTLVLIRFTVFESAEADWIHPERGSVEEIVRTVAQCPSGALTCTVRESTSDAESEDADPAVSVRIVKNGPYEIRGPVEFDYQA